MASSDPASPVDPPRCGNCDAVLHGHFCHACGQEDSDLDLPFPKLVVAVLGELFAFDTRVFRTLRLLFARPGFLTTDYLAGRRARYVPPFRLFVFVSLLLFIVLGATGFQAVVIKVSDGDTAAAASADPPSTVPTAGAYDRGLARFVELARDAPELNRLLINRLAQNVVVLVPIFAVFLRLLFRRSSNRYLHHVVFSFHVHSAGFLAMTPAILIDALLGDPRQGPLGGLVGLAFFPYLFLALRRVYGNSRARTAGKMAILLLCHLVAVLLTMAASLVATLLFE